MLFSSPEFLFVFLPATIAVFAAACRFRSGKYVIGSLLGCSLIFYGWWNASYIVLLLISIYGNYAVAGFLIRTSEAEASLRKTVLRLAIAINLLPLLVYKYSSFFVDTANIVISTNWSATALALPLGISFFTFQQIAYIVDVYRSKPTGRQLTKYALFVAFFPQLIAGPIVHHAEILPQLTKRRLRGLASSNISVGITILFFGLFKKLVIADNLAEIANPVFAAAELDGEIGFYRAWIGTFAFGFQIYFDFSAYSDMAIGLARIFGIRLPENFSSPYQANSIIDFWKRWHITLSRFLRDYVYFSLGGNRDGVSSHYANIMITMLLGGLWHGAGWTFIVWGGIHGLFIVTNHIWRRARKGIPPRWYGIVGSRILTFFVVMVAWVFFRAESFLGVQSILNGMITIPASVESRIGALVPVLRGVGFQFDGSFMQKDDAKFLGSMIFLTLFVWFSPNTQQIMARYCPVLSNKRNRIKPAFIQQAWNFPFWRPTFWWSVYVSLIAMAGILSLNNVTEFIYFQF